MRLEHEAQGMMASRFIPSLQFTGINHEVDLLRLRVHRSAAGIGEALAGKAVDVGASLLVIASHGAGVLADYGSVARWCSENSPTPVLLLPPSVLHTAAPAGGASNAVMVAATDDLAALRNAFHFAVEQLTRPGDNLYVVHVQTPADGEAAIAARKELVGAVLRWQEESSVAHAPTLSVAVDLLTEPASESSVQSMAASSSFDSHSASPAGELLCAQAREFGARAVVLHHHGRSMMRDMMYGPLTLYCTKQCCRPLVVLSNGGQA
jgi:nucleotide-binding universal stress UspA family protein